MNLKKSCFHCGQKNKLSEYVYFIDYKNKLNTYICPHCFDRIRKQMVLLGYLSEEDYNKDK